MIDPYDNKRTPTEIKIVPTILRNASTQELEGIIEFDEIGEPHLLIPNKKISASEAIGFILLANGEKALSMSELTESLSKNWKKQKSNQVSSTLSSMKGSVIPIGSRGNFRYKLSGKGREEMLKIIKILKQK